MLECVLAEEQDDDQAQEVEAKELMPRAPRPKGCKNDWVIIE